MTARNMRQLFNDLKENGYAVMKHENCFTVADEEIHISVSFTKGNYCSNRHDDFGWATTNAEVAIWERRHPFNMILGPNNRSDDGSSGVWVYQNANDIDALIAEYLSHPS